MNASLNDNAPEAYRGIDRFEARERIVADLEAKGLVTLTPRVGAVVNDYRREGSLALLNSLVSYQEGRLEPDLLKSLLDVRRFFEVETARLAARHREDIH